MDPKNEERLLSVLDSLAKVMAHKDRQEIREERWFRVKILMIVSAIALPVAIYATGIANLVSRAAQEHVAIVRIEGAIGGSNVAGTQRSLTAIRQAMRSELSKGLILQINSPGGSPAQAEIIHKTLLQLREQFPEKKVIAVAEDAAASAGYLIATAAETIYAQESSMMGSVGVIFQSYAIHDLMGKVGVKANVRTSGDYKDIGSPYRPWGARDEEVVDQLLADMHGQFIRRVKEGRGSRLKEDPHMFSGRFWTGERALTMGLIDGIATSPEVVAKEFPNLKERIYGQPNPMELLRAFNSRIGVYLETLFRI